MRKSFLLILIFGILIGFFLRDLLREKPAAAKVVTIQSRGLSLQVATTAATVEELLEEQGMASDPNIRMHPNDTNSRHSGGDSGYSGRLIHGTTLEITRPVRITLIDGGNMSEATSTAATVGDFLTEQKIALAETDKITVVAPFMGPDESGSYFLADGMRIAIDRIVDLEIIEEHEIAYETKLEYDAASYYGTEAVLVKGQLGQKEQKFLITYKNGVETKRKLLSQKILREPQTEIRKFGAKVEIEESTEGRASWYTYKNCICAAHPYYDKGRYVRVTVLASEKSIIVKINDQGPELDKHPDRVIDLDSAAFKELAPLGVVRRARQ